MSGSFRVAALVLGRASARSSLHSVSFPQFHVVKQTGVAYGCLRNYANPGRPKKVVGEASKPVKRGARKTTTKTTTPKKKATKAKAKPKKVLTEEQVARKEKRAAKLELKELKKAALQAPKKSRVSAWTTYVKENVPKGRTLQETQTFMPKLGSDFKELSPTDREHYNQLARQQNEALEATYKQWVGSHPIEEIKAANLARQKLRRKFPDAKASRFPKIRDERVVKRPLTPYLAFSVERNASGDFQGISVSERAKLVGQEWRSMSESDKERYKNSASEARYQYQQLNGGAYQQQAAAATA